MEQPFGESNFLTAIAKSIGAVMLTFGAIYVVGYLFIDYKKLPVEEFCLELEENATPDAVINLAKQRGLPVSDVLEARNVIIVANQTSFFFRFYCEIEFNGDKEVSRSVIAGD